MKNLINTLVFFFLFISYQNAISQIEISTFDSLEDKMKIAPKPVIVFIHTDWCMYCKNMESTTFKNTKVVQQLNENFYFISLNAESRETINFLNNSFYFLPNGSRTGVHQLAKELATVNNQIGYPTLTILNNQYEIILQQQSFLNATELLKILEKLS